jgi:hypothetical protein
MTDIRPADHDERMKVAREYARWHLGYADWGSLLVNAYLNPDKARKELDKDKGMAA